MAPPTERTGSEPDSGLPQARQLLVIMEAVTDMTTDEWATYMRHLLSYDEIVSLRVFTTSQ